MANLTVGERAAAFLKESGTEVWLFGFGSYEGEKVPDPGLGVCFLDALVEYENPCILLDSGERIFACECFWTSESDGSQIIAKATRVHRVSIVAERRKRLLARAPSLAAENEYLRRLLFLSHPCPSKYGDDGELQCNGPDCMIDFKRDPPGEIETKMARRGMAQYMREIGEPRHS